MAISSRVVFLGAGIHSNLAHGIEKNVVQLQQLPEPPVLYRDFLNDEKLPYKRLAKEPSSDKPAGLIDISVEVAEQALSEAGISDTQRSNMALFIGSSSFDISLTEAEFERELAENSSTALPLRDPSFSKLADQLVDRLAIGGEDYSFNTACTASANALIAATRQIQAGWIDHALILGIELFNNVTALGFQGLGLLTSSVMKPFDENRDGLVLGEGVSALVIGRQPEGGDEYFALVGAASLSDTHSISAANPDGSSIAQVMQQALDSANINAEQVQGVKVHGTASLSNDESEAAGLHHIFSKMPPLSAIKPYLGHTLGACGLNELILYYRAIEAGFLPATPGISQCPGLLNIRLNQNYTRPKGGFYMLNYFGFGGNNSSLIIHCSADPS